MIFLKIVLILFHVLLFAIIVLLCSALYVLVKAWYKNVAIEKIAKHESEVINKNILNCQEGVIEQIIDLTTKKDINSLTRGDIEEFLSSLKRHCDTLHSSYDYAYLYSKENGACTPSQVKLCIGCFNVYFLWHWLNYSKNDPKKFFTHLKEFTSSNAKDLSAPFYQKARETIQLALKKGNNWQTTLQPANFYETTGTMGVIASLSKEGAKIIEIVQQQMQSLDILFACGHAYCSVSTSWQNKIEYMPPHFQGQPDERLLTLNLEKHIAMQCAKIITGIKKIQLDINRITNARDGLGIQQLMSDIYSNWQLGMNYCYKLTTNFINNPIHSLSSNHTLVALGAFTAMEEEIELMLNKIAEKFPEKLLHTPDVNEAHIRQYGQPRTDMQQTNEQKNNIHPSHSIPAPDSWLCSTSSAAIMQLTANPTAQAADQAHS